MGKSTVGMIEEFSGQVERIAGKAARDQVMTGSERITAKTKDAEVARWMKGAIHRLDELVPEENRIGIMAKCGTNCARVNGAVIERAWARRQKYRSEEEFLAAELKKPVAGTRLERSDGVLHQFYTPRAFSRPMRCYCALAKGLPEDETMSSTYCRCSEAFVKTMWEHTLGRPVEVKIVRSALAGSDECEFEIRLG